MALPPPVHSRMASDPARLDIFQSYRLGFYEVRGTSEVGPMEGEGLSIKFKWSGKIIDIVTHPDEAVEGLKRKLEAATTVLPQRQKLLGLKTQQGKPPSDGTAVRELALKPGMVVMMLG